MAIKKTQIYASLWAMCDKLRGGIDPSQYKNYILTLLFLKYVSDRYADEPFAPVEVPPEARFSVIRAAKNKTNIGETIDKALAAIEKAETNRNALGGRLSVVSFNDDDAFGSGREKIEKLSKLVAIFERPELDFSRNRASGDDIIGDAYEYLMRSFAVVSGKSKGQFYTPGEVSRIMAHLIGVDKAGRGESIYDPACGSGSLLLRAAALVPPEAKGSFSIYGQEIDNMTAGLSMMNFVLHEQPTATVYNGNTLSSPKFLDDSDSSRLKQFDYVVANPPFSLKSWTDGVDTAAFHRFDGFGIPPEKNGDYAWLLHVLASLKTTGSAAIILPHGVLFRGNAEEAIRREVVRRRYIEAIIGLPANIFFGTGIPASIIVLNKSRADRRRGVFFVDASRGFVKDGNKNRLREQDIRKIVDVFDARAGVPHFSRLVPWNEIDANGCNLNIPRYIHPADTSEKHDLDGHLRGGISHAEIDAFAPEWAAFPHLRSLLFKPYREGYDTLAVEPSELFSSILGHSDVAAVRTDVGRRFASWASAARSEILAGRNRPTLLAERLACEMRDSFEGHPLLDRYDAYGVFMDYVLATMQDDLHAVAGPEGWLAARAVEIIRETRHAVEWEGEFIPKTIVEREFFADLAERAAAAETAATDADTALETFLDAERDKGDESPIFIDGEMISDRQLKPNQFRDPADREIVVKCIALKRAAKAAKTTAKDLVAELDAKAHKKYAVLTEDEIKTLLFDRKWFPAIEVGLSALFETTIQTFASSLHALHDRYKDTLPTLEAAAEKSKREVHEVLHSLGFQWEEY